MCDDVAADVCVHYIYMYMCVCVFVLVCVCANVCLSVRLPGWLADCLSEAIGTWMVNKHKIQVNMYEFEHTCLQNMMWAHI